MIEVGSIIFGVLGLLFGVKCYAELWKWARQCQNARIAVAYKQRVQINAPLVEWLGWANQLGKDQATRGRVIYRNGKVSVSILRPADAPRVWVRAWALIRRTAKLRKRTPAPTPPARNASNASNAS